MIKTISIGEDNGFLFGGVPSLVVVDIALMDGKRIRFPYQADKTIADLYTDINTVQSVNIPEAKEIRPMAKAMATIAVEGVRKCLEESVKESNSSEIEKEDIVTCVKVEDRGQGATVDLHVGGQYRVLKVNGKTLTLGNGELKKIVDGYDVIDDSSDVPFRTYVFPQEVVLLRKGVKGEKKIIAKEVDLNCPNCAETVYCGLADGVFSGVCECGAVVSKSKEDWDREHPAHKASA